MRASAPAALLLMLALAGCQTQETREPAQPVTPQQAALDECVALLEKARLWCREHGSARRNSPAYGGRTSLDCMDARLTLRQKCGSYAKP